MTREKYESLPLSTLKALAKSRNMKGISTLRKEALIERMLEEDQKENQKNMEEPAVLKEEKKTETDEMVETAKMLAEHDPESLAIGKAALDALKVRCEIERTKKRNDVRRSENVWKK